MIAFFDYARSSRAVTSNTVHNWLGAISAISLCLTDEERTVEFLQGNPRQIRERLLSAKRDISPRTVDSYLARATTATAQFLSWKKDPNQWELDLKTKPRKERRPPDASARKAAPRPASKASFDPNYPNQVRIPAEGGEMFKLEFPDFFTMSDVRRVAWALAVHASDFDPELVLRGFGKPPVMQERVNKARLRLRAESH
jgi:hypothetical protein